jgi:hypothetical protein
MRSYRTCSATATALPEYRAYRAVLEGVIRPNDGALLAPRRLDNRGREHVREHYLLAREPPERVHDPDCAGGRRLDPPHADAQQVGTLVPAFAREVRRPHAPAPQVRLQQHRPRQANDEFRCRFLRRRCVGRWQQGGGAAACKDRHCRCQRSEELENATS